MYQKFLIENYEKCRENKTLSRYKTGMTDLDFWYLVFSESNILSLILITGICGTQF